MKPKPSLAAAPADKAPTPVGPASHALREYGGDYEHPRYGKNTITLEEEKLFAAFHSFKLPSITPGLIYLPAGIRLSARWAIRNSSSGWTSTGTQTHCYEMWKRVCQGASF